MSKGWLPVLEVGSLGDAGRVGARDCGLFGRGVLEKGKGEMSWGGAPGKGVRLVQLRPFHHPRMTSRKWMEPCGEGWVSS